MNERAFGRETKFQQVRAGLETLAYQLGPEARMPSVRELACQFGTGLNTLSGALQELEARDIVYRRHGVGVFVSPSLSRTICFLVAPEFFARGHSPFWDSLLRAARQKAEAGHEKFELHFAQSSEHLGGALENGLAARLREGHVAGVIGVGLREEAVAWMSEHNVPFVSLFGPSGGDRSVSITLNTPRLIQLGVSHLAQKGCKRIEFWATDSPSESGAQLRSQLDPNAAAFFESLRSHDLTASASAWRYYSDELAPHQSVQLSPTEQGFELARRVFSQPRESWPDGVFCGEDILAQGVLMGLQNLGVQVGRDVQLVSHANSDSPLLLSQQTPMALVEYDVAEIVEVVYQALHNLMHLPPQGGSVRLVAPRLRAPGS